MGDRCWVHFGISGSIVTVVWRKMRPAAQRTVTLGFLVLIGIALPLAAFLSSVDRIHSRSLGGVLRVDLGRRSWAPAPA